MKKSYLVVLIIAVLLVAALIIVPLVIDEPSTSDPSNDPEVPDAADYADRDITGRNIAYVTMTIKDYGEVKLLLDATSAPRTVANFLTLAKSGFYDGTDFCSAIQLYSDASIILGGDPTIDGGEPAPDTVKGEFSANAIETNDLLIKRGVITMFYSGNDYDSATSAFFFSNGNLPDYDGLFAPFGYVISGYKIVDEIIAFGLENTGYYTGLISEEYRPVITSITVDQDIDYSLVSDVYAQPLTEEEISSLLGEDNQAKRVAVLSDHDTIYRAYVDGSKYLFQFLGKVDGSTANLLVSVDNNGKILSAKALSPTKESTSSQLSTLLGLDLASIEAAQISADLKAMIKSALSADVSIISPTAEEIANILGADNEASPFSLSSTPVTFVNGYVDGEDYLFQMAIKGEDGLAILLLHVNKDGKILGASALPLTQDSLAAQVSSIIGLDLATVGTAEISENLKTLAKDAICLAVDLSITAPTEDEIASILGEDNESTLIETPFAPATVLRSYKNGEDYLFQTISKSEDGLALVLLHISKDGKILGAAALPITTDYLAAQVPSMVGLDLAALSDAQLPESLKDLAKDALRTVTAILADDSASKYVHVRDTEDRETFTVEMKIQGYDTPVVILLDKTTAPITVENFLSLVNDGFYDGIIFHRIIKGFMIQGGSFTEAGTSKDSETIKGEFESNGHDNDILHLRGVISMARATDPDSAASGFFICDADSDWLDGEYAAFGYVISGMETVDAIADYSVGKTDSNGNLYSDYDPPVIEYIKLIEN